MNALRRGELFTRPLLVTALLLVPLVAMQFTPEVRWTLSDFIFASVLLLGVTIPLEWVMRRSHGAYRVAAALALVTAFLLTWSNAAVGLTDSAADAFYPLTVLLGAIGATVARFRPTALAWILAGVAVILVLIGTGAVVAGIVPPYNTAPRIFAITAFFAVPLVGSAFPFKRAAHEN